MAKLINRLNPRKISELLRKHEENMLTPEDQKRWSDGNNGYLDLRKDRCSWVFISRWRGKPFEISFGSARNVPLARFRELVRDANAKLAEGIRPTSPRQTTEGTTFGECADQLIESMRPEWKHPNHLRQWQYSMEVHCKAMRDLPVDKVTTEDVLSVLRPIWTTKPQAAARVRGRIERTLGWAKVKGLRTGENPARWKEHLDGVLPKTSKVAKVEHFPAIPYNGVAGLVDGLRRQQGVRARALEFLVLTAARTADVRGARWDEINIADRVWTIPGHRMKAGKDHRVPLTSRALAILEEMVAVRSSELVFPAVSGAEMSHTALLYLLQRIVPDVTTHGFRSAFRDWAAECTGFPSDVIEMALAHAIGSKVEAAYRRGDLFEKRRRLMEAWAGYCETRRGEVIQLRDKVPA